MNLALPMTLSTGTVPVTGSPVHSTPFWASTGVLVQCARDWADEPLLMNKWFQKP